MAKIGLKHIVAALLDESGAAAEYTNGVVVGKAISAGLSVELLETLLYADDGVAESIKRFKSGTLTLGTDDILYPVLGLLLGHEATETSLKANANDVTPFVGVGFYGEVFRGGASKYRAVWLCKCQFKEPADESATKGDSIEFKTATIEGTAFALSNGDWKEEQLFDSEEDAAQWVDTKAGIQTGG